MLLTLFTMVTADRKYHGILCSVLTMQDYSEIKWRVLENMTKNVIYKKNSMLETLQEFFFCRIKVNYAVLNVTVNFWIMMFCDSPSSVTYPWENFKSYKFVNTCTYLFPISKNVSGNLKSKDQLIYLIWYTCYSNVKLSRCCDYINEHSVATKSHL